MRSKKIIQNEYGDMTERILGNIFTSFVLFLFWLFIPMLSLAWIGMFGILFLLDDNIRQNKFIVRFIKDWPFIFLAVGFANLFWPVKYVQYLYGETYLSGDLVFLNALFLILLSVFFIFISNIHIIYGFIRGHIEKRNYSKMLTEDMLKFETYFFLIKYSIIPLVVLIIMGFLIQQNFILYGLMIFFMSFFYIGAIKLIFLFATVRDLDD